MGQRKKKRNVSGVPPARQSVAKAVSTADAPGEPALKETIERPRISLRQRLQPGLSAMPRNRIIGLILGLTFLTFVNCLGNGFVYDDHTQILQNEFIQSLSNAPKAMVTEVWYWRIEQDKSPDKPNKVTTPYYRPAFTLYLMAGWKLFGRWAPGWHLANILMHLVVVYFAFAIMFKVTGDQKIAVIGALLFAVHPLKSESVAWISGLSDLLLAMFLLPSFYFYMIYREKEERKYLAWSGGLFLLAAFSKEPAVSLPLFIIAYELFVAGRTKPLRQRLRPAALYGGSFFVIDALYFALRQYSMGFLLGAKKEAVYSLVSILLTIPIVIAKYVWLLFAPWNLSLYHRTPLVTSALDPRFYLPAIFVALLVALSWWLWKDSTARFGILWFFIMLLPLFNFPALNENFLIQERYLYIPSVGVCLLVAKGLSKITLEGVLPVFRSRRSALAGVVAVIVLAFCGKSFAQNEVWKTDFSLYNHGVEVAPDQPMAHYIMGFQYFKQQNWEKMVDELEKFVQMDDTNMVAIANLATAHLLRFEATQDRSHVDRAIALCELGLNSGEPTEDAVTATMWDTLGHAYTYNTPVKSYEKALVFFQRGLALTSNNPMINMHVGATYLNLGNVDMAFHFLENAKNGDLPEPYKFLAYAYAKRGQIKEAVDNMTKYMTLQPNDLDAPREKRDLDTWKAQLQPQTPSQG